MKQLGFVLAKDYFDEGVITIISKEKHGQSLSFKLSEHNYNSNHVTVNFNKEGDFSFRDFDIRNDSELLDVNFFKENGEFFCLTSDREFNVAILNNELYPYPSEFEKLQTLKEKIDRTGFTVKLKEKINISDISENYVVNYYESGKDKGGDYSRAWIGIGTKQPYNLDNYLKKLFPIINNELGKGEDADNRPFASDIIHYLRNKIIGDNVKVDKIKLVCSEITENIKTLAQLLYNEDEHANSIKTEYVQEYRRLLDKYSPRKNH